MLVCITLILYQTSKDKNLNTWCFFHRAQKEAIANYFTNSITLIVSIRKSWFYAKPYTLLIKKNVKSKFVYVNKNISEKHCACAYHSLVVALFFADLDCASPKC